MDNRKNNLHLAIGMTTLFALSACSGGGAGSTDAVSVQPPTNASKITVTGVMSDTARFNPQLVLRIGDREYTQPVFSSNSEFSFDIDIAAADAEVYLEAVDEATSLALLASLGLFSSLDLDADATLNINEFTTAAYAFAKAQIPDDQPVTAQAVDTVLNGVSAEELTALAAVQYYLMSDDSFSVVPAIYADSLELLVDIVRLDSTFLADIETQSPGVIAAAEDSLLSSETIYIDFSRRSLAGVYFSEDRVVLYALYDNRTGRADFFDDDVAKSLESWNVGDAGELLLKYVIEYDRVDELRLLNATQITMQTTLKQRYAASTLNEANAATFSYFSFATGFDVADVPGVYQLGSSIQLELQAGGGGSLTNTTRNFVEQVIWHVDGEGRIVASADGAGSLTHIIAPLNDGNVVDAVLYSQVLAGGAIEAMSVAAFTRQ